MMRFLVLALLVLAAHFGATSLVPAPAGKGWMFWPFAANTKSWLVAAGVLPQSLAQVVIPLLADAAVIGFIAAGLSLLGIWVPAAWFRPVMLVAASASVLLFGAYFGPLAILPIAIDAFLLWGLVSQGWTIPMLRGG